MRVSQDENHETGKLESMDYIQYYNLRTEKILTLHELDQKNPEPCIVIRTGYYGIKEGEWIVLGKRHREEDSNVGNEPDTVLPVWFVPIFESEVKYIEKYGADRFEDLLFEADELVDFNRKSIV